MTMIMARKMLIIMMTNNNADDESDTDDVNLDVDVAIIPIWFHMFILKLFLTNMFISRKRHSVDHI